MNRETARRFITNLSARCARDSAVAASLRRDADRTLTESRVVLEWAALFHTLGVPAYEEATCHMVATLFAQDRSVKRHAAGDTAQGDMALGAEAASEVRMQGRSLGATMAARVAVAPSEEQSLARRLSALLAATIERDGSGSLPWRLRRTVTLILSRGATIDWERLAYDVSHWNHPEQFVQREWARDFYRERPLAVNVAAGPEIAEQYDETTDTED